MKLKQITLTNFKGTRNRTEIFTENESFIYGPNGSGKTTLFDAFTWLLFGKNSNDEKDFAIKTNDENGVPIPKIDHRVRGVFEINGKEVIIERAFVEKWQKKRGREEEEFTGHETEYFINNVPLKQSEFNAQIQAIIPESIFKMITSPAYFNSLKWDVRRKTLIDIAGKIDMPEFDIENPELKKREIQGAKKRLKDEIDSIQPAITALKTQIIDANWVEIESQIEQQNAALAEIDTAIESQSLAYESQRQAQSEIREKKRKLENELAELRAANRAEYNQKRLAIDAEKAQAERNIVSYNRELAQLYEQLKRQESQLAANETKVQETRNRWKTLNATVAPEYSGQTECPSCNQTLPAAKIQELKNTFIAKWNNKKIADLNEIAEEGKGAKGNIEFLQKEIEVTKSRIYEIEKAIDAIRSVEYTMPTMPIDTPDELALVDEINSIVIPEIKVPEITELKAQKSAITMAIHELHRQLNQRDANDRLNAAIKEKTAKLKSMNQELAQLEKTEFRIKQYEHQMMTAVESAVNGMFTMVKWRMFKTQINGELDPDCECLINGVPYSDANTASQINAGLDIINTLCKHYGYSAPIFIDRRESVTTLIPTDNQIINLVVQ